ncbi:serine hydrolase domain-containing protein [Streptomyces sp. NPDC001985]|uniref:serine hydrolase domain-containing protein n=1 Tax=Streptomyces sp. NPDC001985 TaxID=3154406 RepID=UPI00332A07A1
MTARQWARTGVVGLAAAALAVTAFGAPAGAAATQSTGTGKDHGTGHRATQRALDTVVAAGIPGALAQVRKDGRVWKGAAGVGNRETGAPRGKNDRFRIASITKTFVATVLLQLEAEGRLDLDDTVERHLPGLVTGNGNDGGRITVRQLLNHTSGLFDYLNDPEYAHTYLIGDGFLKHRYDTLAPEFHVRVALGHPPEFAPGSRHAYSNTGYVLAGLIIEKVTGNTYEHEVRERIIKPLGLRSTSQPGNSPFMPRPSGRAYSSLYLPDASRTHDVTEMNGSQGWADGDIISSTGDLTRFFSALMRGDVLPKRQLKAMKTTVAAPDMGTDIRYGLGIYSQRTSCGTVLWGHGGGIVGSLSDAVTTEDGRHALAYNQNGDWAMPVDIAEAEFCGTTRAGARARF